MIGKYEIIKKLGEGTFADTYLAVDGVTRHKVALKVYKQFKGALEAAKKDILPLIALEHSISYHKNWSLAWEQDTWRKNRLDCNGIGHSEWHIAHRRMYGR